MSERDIDIIHERESLRDRLGSARRLGVVVIDGPLHYRHLACVSEARAVCDEVVAVALVGRDERAYVAAPEVCDRPIDAEARHLASAGATVYFTPTLDDMYPFGAPMLGIDTSAMSQLTATSAYTDAYFAGMVAFYAKLISIVRPTDLFVSQKDLQLAAAVRQYVRDFDVDAEVHQVMVTREEDGLAADPVNAELDDTGRAHARAIVQSLYRGVQAAAATGSAQAVLDATREYLDAAEGVEVIQVDLLEPLTLGPAVAERGTAVLVVVARVGGVTLSDNMLVVLRRS